MHGTKETRQAKACYSDVRSLLQDIGAADAAMHRNTFALVVNSGAGVCLRPFFTLAPGATQEGGLGSPSEAIFQAVALGVHSQKN